MADEEAGGFASLMSSAADAAAPPAEEAPFGWTTDKDGTRRPKKTQGRPRTSPPIEELRAAAAEIADDAPPPPADRAPSKPKTTALGRAKTPPAPLPPYREGVITAGVNKLYRRAGKIVRAMDDDIGTAIIESAKNTADEGEENDSVGAAWDRLARTNPRIRRFLLRVIAGGAWGDLIMAHAPIALAIVMKPRILAIIPFSKIIQSMAEPDEDTPEGEGGLPGGMTAADTTDMAALANAQMTKIAAQMGITPTPEMTEQAMAMAMKMNGAGNGSGSPPKTQARVQQPRARARAARHGGLLHA
jgi:hypothetical protein